MSEYDVVVIGGGAAGLAGAVALLRARRSVLVGDGAAVVGRRLLVATGLVDELPDVPGVAERWGSDVLHCPYCHGWEVRDQPLGVLGDGPMAVHQALMWR